MIVLLGFYKRKAGLSLEEFQRHWREIHGPLLAQNPACLEHIRRYVQHQCVPGVPGVLSGADDGDFVTFAVTSGAFVFAASAA